MRNHRMILALLMALMIGLLWTGVSLASDEDDDKEKKGKMFQVTITNLTKKQVFSPPLVVSHKKSIQLFEVGQPASDGIVAIAETGNTMPLEAVLGTLDEVFDYAVGGMPLEPGKSMTLKLKARGPFNRLSFVAMLVSTNDAFAALNSTRFPHSGKKMVHAIAYDAGSEANTELCKDVPGPCTDQDDTANDRVTDKAEGYVYVHNGIHGVDEMLGLNEANMDWRNPVAKVVIQMMRH